MDSLVKKIEGFRAEFGLSEHRVGIVLAKNGRLLPRLRGGGRVWPNTEADIIARIEAETRKRRSLTQQGAA